MAEVPRSLSVVLVAVAFGGCGGGTEAEKKLTADQAARALERRASGPIQVRRVSGEGPFASFD
jgi:hypothetical protein